MTKMKLFPKHRGRGSFHFTILVASRRHRRLVLLTQSCNVVGYWADWAILLSGSDRGKTWHLKSSSGWSTGVCSCLDAGFHVQSFARWDFCLPIFLHSSSVNQWERLAAKSSSGRCQFIFFFSIKDDADLSCWGIPRVLHGCVVSAVPIFHYCSSSSVLLAAHM